MAIAFVSEAHANMAFASITVNVPSGVADGDLLLAFINSTDATAAPGASWTSLVVTQPRGGEDFAVFYRVASSEPASYTWSWGAGVGIGAILAYRGVNTSSPLDASGVAGTAVTSGTTITAPTVTTATAGAMLICAYAHRQAGTFSTPTGMTERFAGSGVATSLAVDEESRASAGATGTRASTVSAPINFGRAISFGIRAAVAGGPNRMMLLGVG